MAVSPGVYAGVTIDPEQASIANTIASVGYSMGATQRDVTVAYMAAMAESSMRNLHSGDRDSQGVFQQRPSQGWGTVAQVTDPTYASRKFFEALFAVPARDSLSLQMEAQRVQRSAFSDGSNYAKWSALAQALIGQNPSSGGGSAPAGGGDSGTLGGIGSALGGIAEAMSGFGKIAVWLAVPNHWTRIFAGGFGVVFIVFGLRTIAKEVHS